MCVYICVCMYLYTMYKVLQSILYECSVYTNAHMRLASDCGTKINNTVCNIIIIMIKYYFAVNLILQ